MGACARVTVSRGGVGGVGRGRKDATVLDLLLGEELVNFGRRETGKVDIVVVVVVVASSSVDGGRPNVRARDRWEASGQATCSCSVTSDCVVGRTGMEGVGESRSGSKSEEQDQIQADKHQLEGRLKRDHDAV